MQSNLKLITLKLLLFIIGLSLYLSTSAKELGFKDFLKPSEARGVQISPNGKFLSVVFKRDGKEMLGILELATMKPHKVFYVRGERRNVGRVYWASNERIIYSVSQSFDYDESINSTGELIGVDIDGSNHKVIFGWSSVDKRIGKFAKQKKNAEFGSHQILDLLKEDPKHILIAFYPWKESFRYWKINPDVNPTVYKLDINSGRKRKVDNLPLPLSIGLTDNAGNLRFAVGGDDENIHQVYVKQNEDGKWKPFELKGVDLKRIIPLVFSDKNDEAYFVANTGYGTQALFTLNIESLTLQKIFQDDIVDIESIIENFDRN